MKKEEFKKCKLPESSGVYFFLNKKTRIKNIRDLKRENILYIGKATVLKDRVGSYFSNDLSKTRSTKISSMIENSKDIFFIETKSVLEAIILESKYIKEFQPVFNTREKDDKSYSYILITQEEFPRILIVRLRELLKDFEEKNKIKIKAEYGPFVSKGELLEIMKFIRKIFPYRDKCKIGEKRGCFNQQIGLCPGTCIGLISKKDYEKNIKNIEKILSGNIEKLLKDLAKKMNLLAKEKKFEDAAKIRDKINSFSYIKDINFIKSESNFEKKRKINIENQRIESYDISHISGKNRVGVMCVFEDGELNKSEYKKFKINENINDDIKGLFDVLERRFKHREWRYPDILVIDGGKTHLGLVVKKLEKILLPRDFKNIKIASVVKNAKHKPENILATSRKDKKFIESLKNEIFMLNEETHRFAISYHRFLRSKNFKSQK